MFTCYFFQTAQIWSSKTFLLFFSLLTHSTNGNHLVLVAPFYLLGTFPCLWAFSITFYKEQAIFSAPPARPAFMFTISWKQLTNNQWSELPNPTVNAKPSSFLVLPPFSLNKLFLGKRECPSPLLLRHCFVCQTNFSCLNIT